ncbi:hypothetical protein ALC57_18460, partial [Trachymyrmex cornetzi]
KRNLTKFCFQGEVNNKRCILRIDTGSDVSILNDNLIESNQCKIKIDNCSLTYPTGEKVSINYKVHTKVRLRSYLVEISMLVAKINDDCILDIDFLEKLNLGNIFESIFNSQKETSLYIEEKNDVQCFRVKKSFDFDVPSNLRSLLEKDSEYLTQSQKKLFAELLNEFSDIFSEQIVAGNCEVGEHLI